MSPAEIIILIIGISMVLFGIGLALYTPKHNECGTRSKRTPLSGGTKYVVYYCPKCKKSFSAEHWNKNKQI